MNKKYSEMNDFDKIILSHQENNDDIAELSNFRNEKWKALDIERTKKPSEYLSKERLPTMLRYLIIEDMSNKRWFIYDSDISRTYFIDFGEYTLFLLNDILGYLPDFPYHKQKRKEALNFITEEDYEDTKNIICDNKEKFIELFVCICCMRLSYMAGARGLEPPSCSFGDCCVTNYTKPLWGGRRRSNPQPLEPQSNALSQLSYVHMATTRGLEPPTSGVTGRRSSLLSYVAKYWRFLQGSNLRPSG